MRFKRRDGSYYDTRAKHLYFEMDGRRYDIFFKYSVLKGMYDIRVHIDNKKANIKIIGAYPPLREVVLFTLVMIAPKRLENFFTKLWLRHSREPIL